MPAVTLPKIQAFCREFPWLTKYIDELTDYLQWMRELSVQRLDLEVLEQVPFTCSFSGSTRELRFIIIDASDNVLHEVTRSRKIRTRPYSLFLPNTWFAEEIGGQKLGEALSAYPGFKYVLRIEENGIVPSIVIFKLPNTWDLQEWIEELQRRESIAVQEEVAASGWDGKTIDISSAKTTEGMLYRASFPGSGECFRGGSAEEALGRLVQNNSHVMGLEIRVQ